MRSFFNRARAAFSNRESEIPVPVAVAEEDRLQILVGRQKAITRGRGSLTGSEGLVRDAV